jgi:hypothetical protein
MIVIPETSHERDLLWRRRDAVQYVLGPGVPLRICEPGGDEIQRLSQPPRRRLRALDRQLRRLLLLCSGGHSSSP